MKKTKWILTMMLIGIVISSCSVNNEKNKSDEFIKLLYDPNVKDVNESLELRLDPFRENTLKIGEKIYLEAMNKSNKEIIFSANNNVQIFTYDPINKNWRETKNLINYYGKGYSISPVNQNGLHSVLVKIDPVIESQQKNVKIRIAVTGYIFEDGQITKDAVSSYYDLELRP
jgi:hypothetical protein